jgi:tetratricopeptide (TPR) repeat protein
MYVFRPIQCVQCGQSFTPAHAASAEQRMTGFGAGEGILRASSVLLWIGVAIGLGVLSGVVTVFTVLHFYRPPQIASASPLSANAPSVLPAAVGGSKVGQSVGNGVSPPVQSTAGSDVSQNSGESNYSNALLTSFDKFNFTFDSAPPGWVKINSNLLVPGACLAFGRRFPTITFFVIAESTDISASADTLADLAVNRLRTKTDDVQTIKRFPQTIHGIAGMRMLVRAHVHGLAVSYSYWFAATHGYLYQLVAYGATEDESEVESQAFDLCQNFRLIDPNRMAAAAQSGGEPVGFFYSTDYGISMNLASSSWRRSARFAKLLPGAVLCGEQSATTYFSLQGYSLGALNPPIDYFARAACKLHQASFDDANNIQRSTSPDGTEFCQFEVNRTYQSIQYLGFYRLIIRPGFAYLFRGETANSADLPELHAIADKIRLDTFPPEKAPELNAEGKKSESLLLNDIGIQYENEKQLAKAADYIGKALDCSSDLVILSNLLGAQEAMGDFTDALASAQRGAKLFPGELVLLAKEAGFQTRLKDFSGAAATYHDLFATDYRDDNAFHQYVLVLQHQSRMDDAIAACSAYLAKSDSQQIGIDLALLYDLKGKHDHAIQLLQARWDKDHTDFLVGGDLALVLVNSAKYHEAVDLAQQLISAGNHDVDVYTILGEAQFGMAQYRQAKASFETALQISPESPVLKKWLASASAMLGEQADMSIQQPIAPVDIPPSLVGGDADNPAVAIDSKQDAWYLRHITAISFVPNDHLKTTEYRLIKVLDQRGVDDFSKLEFPFDPLLERIYLNKLEVRDANNQVVGTTDVSHCFVVDENGTSTHSSRKVLTIPVDGLSVGHTIDLVVTQQENSPPAHMQYKLEVLAGRSPGTRASLWLGGNRDSVKAVESAGLKPTVVGDGLCWSVSPMPQYQAEPQQPPFEAFLPYVAVGDNGDTWESVGKDYLDLIAPQMASDANVTALSEELTKNASTDAQKIDAIVKYVQHNYTYTAVEFGRRARIPNSAGEIVHAKSGDCKDHAVLLVQLLKAASIPCELAVANFEDTLQPDLPSLDQFTHVVVCIPSRMPDGFIDCTNKLCDVRSGVPLGLGGHQVLLLDATHPRLVRIPEYLPGAFAVRDTRTATISETGSVTVDEEIVLSGAEAAGFRYVLGAAAQADRLNQMQRFLAAHGAEVTLSDLKIENLEDASEPLDLKLNFTVLNCFSAWSGQMVGSVPALLERYWLVPEPAEQRLTPFKYSYPVQLSFNSKINLPSGYAWVNCRANPKLPARIAMRRSISIGRERS